MGAMKEKALSSFSEEVPAEAKAQAGG